jgi:hypothetical protein
MVKMRSLDCDSCTDDRWEVVESCEDGFFEFLRHVSTTSSSWSLLGDGGRLTHRVVVSLKLKFDATYGSACLMTIVLEPSPRGVTRVPRYTKFAVPPESSTSELQAYGLSLRLC